MGNRRLTSLNEYLAQITDLANRHLAYRWGWYAASAGLVLLIGAGYWGAADRCGRSGYPLDDAWIHQCYARTLAQTGQFAFAPGQPSTGSTSLLWTLLLSLGHLLRLPPVPWSYGLGALAWLLTAWTAQRLARRLFPRQRSRVPWVALACLLEWHLAWAALSGMESMLFCFLSLLLLERYAARAPSLGIGVVGGFLVLTRPEGLILVGAVLLATLAERQHLRTARGIGQTRVSRVLFLLLGLAAVVLPYLALNLSISGQLFPSTLYAKQAEYRELLDQPLWRRLWVVARRPLIGAQMLLLPGFVWQAYVVQRSQIRSIKETQTPNVRAQAGQAESESLPSWATLLPLAWWATYHGIYALRLPVDYQHGRYLMPALPILLLYGVPGTLDRLRWATQEKRAQRFHRVWTRALAGALGILSLAFLVLGGQAYAEDRCIIRQEMVDVALWLRDNTPSNARVAAHDIGAIGYWARRPLLDLAGLINPEVIPVMRDESRLIEYIVDQKTDYLVVFPSWYPILVQDDRLLPVYPTQGQAMPPPDRDHMTIYHIPPAP